MALGQLVAISVATNLFFLTILLKDNQKRTRRSTTIAPPTLWVSVLVALLAVGISPYTDATTFLPNLLVMHFFVFLPLLPVGYNTRSMFAIRTKTLYLLAATVAVGLRLRTTYAAAISLPAREQSVLGFLSAALATLHAHPAQSSIGWDVIWTTISLLLWLAFAPPTATPSSARRTKPPRSTLLMSAITSLLFSVGIGAPLAFHQDVDDSTLTKAQVS
ncbi:hypothetical protein EUX98_g5469 [Antrodiella citrinella]|uniref:Uncharacterized protein n=1 Tax=Antrodiella citrinella TaxID=2447956 RepID=A0A4S4MRP4_9APHY|nr:hypothetical protein EUX98_g5469 [Antrodiella citrinella]